MKFAASLLIGLSLFGLAQVEAGGCGTVATVTHATNYGHATVVHREAKIVTPVVATFVTVPLYTAVYVPAYQPPAPAAPPVAATAPAKNDDMREMLQLLKSMDSRIQKLEGAKPSPANPPVSLKAPAGHPGLAALGAKCAGCHDAKVAADKGGALTLFANGSLVALSDRQIRRVLVTTQKQSMPPASSGVKLSDEEAASIVALFDKP